MHRVLQAVDAGEPKSQRHLAAEIGIALGLADAYVKRRVRKGLTPVAGVTARHVYYLAPQSFAEKSGFTADYPSASPVLAPKLPAGPAREARNV